MSNYCLELKMNIYFDVTESIVCDKELADISYGVCSKLCSEQTLMSIANIDVGRDIIISLHEAIMNPDIKNEIKLYVSVEIPLTSKLSSSELSVLENRLYEAWCSTDIVLISKKIRKSSELNIYFQDSTLKKEMIM